MISTVCKTGCILGLVIIGTVHGRNWSFAVISDTREKGTLYRAALHEIRDKSRAYSSMQDAEYVVVNGDIGGVDSRIRTFEQVFRTVPAMKAFFPVVGNHESRQQRERIIRKVLPELDSIHMMNAHTGCYFADWKNVRLIMLDQYRGEMPDGCLDEPSIKWAADCIAGARIDAALDHVFIFIHEPAFPRYRHLDDSFNKCPKQRDAFWREIVADKDMVRAVFNGHTHTYSRIRVADPECESANNPAKFPDQEHGVYQIDSGAAGQVKEATVVRITVDGTQARALVVQTKGGLKGRFEIIDEWVF